jgi:transcriptional regulator with XRE-family HTH domain
MAAASSGQRVGLMLREWRRRRRMSQLELALDAGVSARHISFVETGRSKPGREMLLRVAEQLQLPFRERNHLLLAAGHAPAFPERSLDDPELAPVREALELVLRGHEPYPAIAVDRQWNLVAANASVAALTSGVDIDPALLEPPVNVLRLGIHPRGLGPLLVNPGEWRAYFRERIERQAAITGDEELAAIVDEVAALTGPDEDAAAETREAIGPLRMRASDGRELAFYGMYATFETPFEVTTSELAIELLFPADAQTAEALRQLP